MVAERRDEFLCVLVILRLVTFGYIRAETGVRYGGVQNFLLGESLDKW